MPAQGPLSVWLTDSGKSHVRIAPCDRDSGDLCGKIVCFRQPHYEDGVPWLNRRYGDETLRSRPLQGIQVPTGAEDEGDGE